MSDTVLAFYHNGRRYLAVRSPDGRRVSFKTSFSREMNIAFGRRTRWFSQHGYRQLPDGGPLYRLIRDAYEALTRPTDAKNPP